MAVTIFSLALGVVSNTLEPAVLGHKVLELVPEQKNAALGFTTFAGLIVAILWQPIVGAWSDRTQGPWGRRAPYFVAGTLLVLTCLYAIALAPAFTVVVAGVLLLQLASNTVQGPWQALIPDQVPPGDCPPELCPPVSVLIAAYNEAKVIRLTLRSVLDTRYPGPLEVILVDDGSEDGTGDIVAALAREDGRIRLLRQPNRGKARALKVFTTHHLLEGAAAG